MGISPKAQPVAQLVKKSPAMWAVAQLCPTLCDPVDCSTSGLPAAAAAKSLQSCPTLCDPRDDSPPGSVVPGILQARTLEWVVPTAWQDEALARDGVSREVPCSALKGETVPDIMSPWCP